MATPAVLGLDVGTGSVKVVALSSDGTIVAEAVSAPLLTYGPEPGAAEQDPDALWEAVADAIRSALSFSPGPEVRAVAMAAQSGSVIPIGAGGEGSCVFTWMDTRSRPLIDAWSKNDTAMIRRTTGWNPSPGLGLSTISWLHHRDRLAFEATTRFASVDDYLTGRLVGSWTTNPTNASGMQLMDVGSRSWSDAMCGFAGIRTDQLSRIAPTGESVGCLTDDAATGLGLEASVPLVAGGHDQTCAALGLGVVETGSRFLSAGTAWVLTTVVDHCDVSRIPAAFNLSPHCVASRWSASCNLGGLGAAIAWWFEHAGITPGSLDQDLARHRPGVGDPLFIPKPLEPQDWGRFTSEPSGSEMLTPTWAVLESAGFEVRRNLDSLDHRPVPLTLVGGGGTRVTGRIIAAATGCTVLLRERAPWPALGAARLAADALGWMLPVDLPGKTVAIEPEADLAEACAERYPAYLSLIEGDLP